MTKKIDGSRNVLYTGHEIEIRQTVVFDKWFQRLRDRKAKLRIIDRVKRFAMGNVGDTKAVGDGVQELRMPFGPAYRVYYIWQGSTLVLLLTGGDKSTQTRDIAKAKQLAKDASDGIGNSSL